MRLLERSTRRVELTRAGEVFYDWAVRIIGDVGLSTEVARSAAGNADDQDRDGLSGNYRRAAGVTFAYWPEIS